jgi:hypothetical protein
LLSASLNASPEHFGDSGLRTLPRDGLQLADLGFE